MITVASSLTGKSLTGLATKTFSSRVRVPTRRMTKLTWNQKNHVVRKYGFYYRYDTPQALKVLGQLWKVVCLRMNLFTGLS